MSVFIECAGCAGKIVDNGRDFCDYCKHTTNTTRGIYQELLAAQAVFAKTGELVKNIVLVCDRFCVENKTGTSKAFERFEKSYRGFRKELMGD